MAEPRFVIVAGLSGAGKSQAMNALEDLGFHCVDNFPPILIPAFIELMQRAGKERVALALDVRSGGPVGEALDAITTLDAAGIAHDVLFLEADDEVLVRRYSETRRKHPLSENGRVFDSIATERRSLAELRQRAERIWDTSHMLASNLKDRISATYGDEAQSAHLRVIVLAFGYKFGVPSDADLVFDVRFLPNPNYIPELQPLTGVDRPVEEFMEKLAATRRYLEHLYGFLDYCIPEFIAEGKTTLTVAVGCTGGRHRSVYIARRLYDHIVHRSDVRTTFITRDVVT